MIPLGVLASSRVAPAGGLVVADAFNRADSTVTLGTTDTGQTWLYTGTSGSSVWGISSNAAYKVSPNDNHSVAGIDLGSADMIVSARIAVHGPTAPYPGVAARASLGGSSGYFVWAVNANSAQVARRIGTAQVLLANNLPVSAVGTVFTLKCVEEAGGTRVQLFWGGALQWEMLDSTIGRPMGTLAGIFFYGAASPARLDDFTAEAL